MARGDVGYHQEVPTRTAHDVFAENVARMASELAVYIRSQAKIALDLRRSKADRFAAAQALDRLERASVGVHDTIDVRDGIVELFDAGGIVADIYATQLERHGEDHAVGAAANMVVQMVAVMLGPTIHPRIDDKAHELARDAVRTCMVKRGKARPGTSKSTAIDSLLRHFNVRGLDDTRPSKRRQTSRK